MSPLTNKLRLPWPPWLLFYQVAPTNSKGKLLLLLLLWQLWARGFRDSWKLLPLPTLPTLISESDTGCCNCWGTDTAQIISKAQRVAPQQNAKWLQPTQDSRWGCLWPKTQFPELSRIAMWPIIVGPRLSGFSRQFQHILLFVYLNGN